MCGEKRERDKMETQREALEKEWKRERERKREREVGRQAGQRKTNHSGGRRKRGTVPPENL